MSKVILSGYILVPDADLAVVEAELPRHIENTRQESGCLVFEVVRDEANPNRFEVYEEFTDQRAFEHHQQRVGRSRWGQVTSNVARHYQIEGLD